MPQVYLEKLKANVKQKLLAEMESLGEDQRREIWKPVKEYKGWYSVSNLGRVKRIAKGKGTKVGRFIKPIRKTLINNIAGFYCKDCNQWIEHITMCHKKSHKEYCDDCMREHYRRAYQKKKENI